MTIQHTPNYFFAQELGDYRIHLEKLTRNLKDLKAQCERAEARNRKLRRKVKRLTSQLNAQSRQPAKASSRPRAMETTAHNGATNTDFQGALSELNGSRS